MTRAVVWEVLYVLGVFVAAQWIALLLIYLIGG